MTAGKKKRLYRGSSGGGSRRAPSIHWLSVAECFIFRHRKTHNAIPVIQFSFRTAAATACDFHPVLFTPQSRGVAGWTGESLLDQSIVQQQRRKHYKGNASEETVRFKNVTAFIWIFNACLICPSLFFPMAHGLPVLLLRKSIAEQEKYWWCPNDRHFLVI